MKAKIEEMILMDGSSVFDINIFPNGSEGIGDYKKDKVIISCVTEKDAVDFFIGLDELIKKHTLEKIEEV